MLLYTHLLGSWYTHLLGSWYTHLLGSWYTYLLKAYTHILMGIIGQIKSLYMHLFIHDYNTAGMTHLSMNHPDDPYVTQKSSGFKSYVA